MRTAFPYRWARRSEDTADVDSLLSASNALRHHLDRAAAQAGHLGTFVRSLVGLDRNAAKAAFAGFLDAQRYNADQITFVNLLIDELTAAGVVPARRFYEAPFVDLAPEGPELLFGTEDLDRIFDTVGEIQRRATAE
jgi:type I restriction enzyme, R subunit